VLTAIAPSRVIGRYAIYDEIASGGMATVHFGRLMGAVGFTRTVAIKCLHAHLAKDPEFAKMFLDEARVAARIRHPNVVPTLDVVNTDGQVFLVMEYVQGESLARLQRLARDRHERIPVPVACAIAVGVLQGLHAAHEATDENGDKLGIVHRDVSPQNILVGRDGVAHVLDFGVAKAAGQLQTTRDGQLKGKLGYMPPDQIRGQEVTRATDIYAASVVLWEMLAGERLFAGENEANILERVLYGEIGPPSSRGAKLPEGLDEVVVRGLSPDPRKRFSTAREMARAIEAAVPIAPAADVSEWVESLAGATFDERQRKVTEIESSSDVPAESQLGAALSSVSEAAGTEAQKSAKSSDDSPIASALKSELSSVSVSTDDVFASIGPPPRRRLTGLVAVAAVLGLVAVVVVVARQRATIDVPASTGSVATAPSSPPTSTASTSAVATTTVNAAPSPPPIPSAAVPKSTTTPPRTGAPPKGRAKEIIRDLPGQTQAPKPKPGCNPPYYFDSEGLKQYKVECL
jgi:serine/threonine protein kinase